MPEQDLRPGEAILGVAGSRREDRGIRVRRATQRPRLRRAPRNRQLLARRERKLEAVEQENGATRRPGAAALRDERDQLGTQRPALRTVGLCHAEPECRQHAAGRSVGLDGGRGVARTRKGERIRHGQPVAHDGVADRSGERRAVRAIGRRAHRTQRQPVPHQRKQVGRRAIPGTGAVVAADALERLGQQHQAFAPRHRVGGQADGGARLNHRTAVAPEAKRRTREQFPSLAIEGGVEPGGIPEQLFGLPPAVPPGRGGRGNQFHFRCAERGITQHRREHPRRAPRTTLGDGFARHGEGGIAHHRDQAGAAAWVVRRSEGTRAKSRASPAAAVFMPEGLTGSNASRNRA